MNELDCTVNVYDWRGDEGSLGAPPVQTISTLPAGYNNKDVRERARAQLAHTQSDAAHAPWARPSRHRQRRPPRTSSLRAHLIATKEMACGWMETGLGHLCSWTC